MLCRYDMSKEARKKVAVLDMVITALKLIELAIVINERRRINDRRRIAQAQAERMAHHVTNPRSKRAGRVRR